MTNKEIGKVFLLGAGFTYDISDGEFPLMRDLNKEIASEVDDDLVEKYGFGRDDFEICLTKLEADLFHTFAESVPLEVSLESLKYKHKRLRENREKIRYYLADRFSMKGQLPKLNSTVRKFLDHIIKKNDIVLTTNYDFYLENLLGPKRWSPHGGYGKRMRWLSKKDENSKLDNIKIFKLHGSSAFRIVPISDDLERRGDIELSIKKENFPNFYSELGWADEEGPYLILPSFIKPLEFNAISELYKEAIEEVKIRNKLIIIGSSLREEDYILWFILSYFDRRTTQIIIVDLNAEDLKKSITDNLHFHEENIFSLSGKLSEKIDELIFKLNKTI